MEFFAEEVPMACQLLSSASVLWLDSYRSIYRSTRDEVSLEAFDYIMGGNQRYVRSVENFRH